MSTIVLNGDNWVIKKVCNYLIGQEEKNVNIWRRKFNDQFLIIKQTQQNDENICISITTDNPFVKIENITSTVVDKLEKTIIQIQEKFNTQYIPMMITITLNGYKAIKMYTDGICESSHMTKEIITYVQNNNDFPAL